jgi:hypothetical protein
VVSDNHFIFFDKNNPFIKKFNLEENEALEGDLKPEEMLVVLKNMKNGKSPELDGFTTEFYNFFWSDLNYFAVRSFNQAYTRGESKAFSKSSSIKTPEILLSSHFSMMSHISLVNSPMKRPFMKHLFCQLNYSALQLNFALI